MIPARSMADPPFALPMQRSHVSRRLLQARAGLKGFAKKARARYVRMFYSFGPVELARALRRVDLRQGDSILVHSSFDAFEGFEGKPSDVIDALKQAVGTDGLLMMPTMPFSGTAIDWVRSHSSVDLRRTPSRMGLISEIFRRSPDVIRSVHPTHSVAAWGAPAAEFVACHPAARTPCGVGSPYHGLLTRDGSVLLLGVDVNSVTLYHTAEELLEKQLPVSPFMDETFKLQCVAPDGTTIAVETRLFDPAVSRRRNLERLGLELKQRGAWREARVGRLAIVSIKARHVIEAVTVLAGRGIYCYDEDRPSETTSV